jgi:hypothetical protein
MGASVTPSHLTDQSGGFSPFMFGLVMGMSVFSALSMQWAKQELTRYQELQADRAKTNAEEVAKGLEFAILTENEQSYSDTYDLERASAYSAAQTRTRGGQEYMLAARDSEREQFGQKATSVAIVGTDDTLVRSQVYRTETEEHILDKTVGGRNDVAVYDTSLARNQQVMTSNSRMESMAERLYTFYAAKFRFPTDSEYQSLLEKVGVRDAWGQDFDYTPEKDGQKATLSFTTPWQYTQTMILSLKDEEKKAEYNETVPTEPTTVSPTDE